MRGTTWSSVLLPALCVGALAVAACAQTAKDPAEGTPPDAADVAAATSAADATTGTATTGTATTTDATATASAAPAGPDPLWRHEAVVLAQPTRLDGTVLAHVGSTGQGGRRGVDLVALDARTGARSWSVPVGLSQVYTVDAPTVLDGTVISLAGRDGRPAHVVALDPADGTELARTQERLTVNSLPGPCPGDGEKVCLSGYVEAPRDYRTWQVRVADGRVDLVAPPPTHERPFGTDGPEVRLSQNWADDTAVFEGWLDGEVRWEVSAEDVGLDLTGLRGAAGSTSTRDGTYVHDVLYVGIETATDEDVEIPLEDHRLLVLDARTGDRVWSRRATTWCAGSPEVRDVLVTCTGQGTALLAGPPGETSFEADDVVLRGVERATGRVLWEHDITAEDWSALDALPGPVGAGQALVQVDGERRLLDVRTGELLAPGAVPPGGYVCSGRRTWGTVDGEPRESDLLAYPCTATSRPSRASSSETVELLTGHQDGTRLVTAPDSITVYPADL